MEGLRFSCAGCGERIGVYEPLRWRRPDGSTVETGYLALIQDPSSAHPASRFYHKACRSASTATSAPSDLRSAPVPSDLRSASAPGDLRGAPAAVPVPPGRRRRQPLAAVRL